MRRKLLSHALHLPPALLLLLLPPLGTSHINRLHRTLLYPGAARGQGEGGASRTAGLKAERRSPDGFKHSLTSHSDPVTRPSSQMPVHSLTRTAVISRKTCPSQYFITERGASPRLYLRVHGRKRGSVGLSAHSSLAANGKYLRRPPPPHNYVSYQSLFSGPQLPTAYEKAPIKQLSLKVGPNSVI